MKNPSLVKSEKISGSLFREVNSAYSALRLMEWINKLFIPMWFCQMVATITQINQVLPLFNGQLYIEDCENTCVRIFLF